MNFKELYQTIPDKREKRKIRNKIIESTKVQHSTFYSWLFRNKIPLLAQEKIAEIMCKPQIELFPIDEETEC